MRIQSVKMQNFRGFRKGKKFLFEEKPFVLLSAPNGLGKTTVIDAVEWCLTGSISRLKNAFDTRSTNEDERKKNVDGILKNKKASNTDEILVVLEITYEDKKYVIKRIQKKDVLNAKESRVWINNNEELAAKLLPRIVDKNFYNFHYCDVHKAIQIQNRKRKDLPDLFSEFITDYTRESSIADNLELFVEDTKRYKQDLEKRAISEERIGILKKELKDYERTPVIQAYPQIPIYAKEHILISELDVNQLNNQLDLLYKYGYRWAYILLEEITGDEEARNIEKYLMDMEVILESKREHIEETMAQELHKGNKKIRDIEQKINQYIEIELSRDNIWDYSEMLVALDNEVFTEEKYKNAKDEIQPLENSLKKIKEEIEILSDGNEIIDLLATLISRKRALKKYRAEMLQKNQKAQCPVCGSEKFGQIEEEQILNNARNYIEQHGLFIAEKKRIKDQLEQRIKVCYESLIRICNQVLVETIQNAKVEKENFEELKESTKDFFEKQKVLERVNSQKYTLERLIEPGYISSVRSEMEKKFLSDGEIIQKREKYKKLLELLGHKLVEDESEKVVLRKVHGLAEGALEILEYSYSLLVQKINSINSIVNNKKYLDLKGELEAAKEKNQNIEAKKEMLEILYNKAEKRVKDIRGLIGRLKAEEYNMVGPNLFKFYKKLSRINSIEGIQLKQEEDMLSIVDESGKNVVNILSNGQLSVFMLAYFFAGIISRNRREMCKIYFIDDLTACMDDVNMLAFLDLMKYQLSAKDGTMDQIIFASCDERICKLLRYKLNGCGIDYYELTEKNFS